MEVCGWGHTICLTLSLSCRRLGWRDKAWRLQKRQAEASQNCYIDRGVDLCHSLTRELLAPPGYTLALICTAVIAALNSSRNRKGCALASFSSPRSVLPS